jgi:hypothetical protein
MCECMCKCKKNELIGFAVLELLNEKRENRKTYMRSYMNTYYEGHKEVILQQQVEQKKRYRETHLEEVKARQKAWYAKKKALKLLAKLETPPVIKN